MPEHRARTYHRNRVANTFSEEIGAMLQLRLLLFELRKLGFAMFEGAMVSAPCEHSVRPGDGMASKGSNDNEGQRRERRAPDQLENAVPSPHESQGITREPVTQVKRMIW